jgi:hypothetical protein
LFVITKICFWFTLWSLPFPAWLIAFLVLCHCHPQTLEQWLKENIADQRIVVKASFGNDTCHDIFIHISSASISCMSPSSHRVPRSIILPVTCLKSVDGNTYSIITAVLMTTTWINIGHKLEWMYNMVADYKQGGSRQEWAQRYFLWAALLQGFHQFLFVVCRVIEVRTK